MALSLVRKLRSEILRCRNPPLAPARGGHVFRPAETDRRRIVAERWNPFLPADAALGALDELAMRRRTRAVILEQAQRRQRHAFGRALDHRIDGERNSAQSIGD